MPGTFLDYVRSLNIQVIAPRMQKMLEGPAGDQCILNTDPLSYLKESTGEVATLSKYILQMGKEMAKSSAAYGPEFFKFLIAAYKYIVELEVSKIVQQTMSPATLAIRENVQDFLLKSGDTLTPLQHKFFNTFLKLASSTTAYVTLTKAAILATISNLFVLMFMYISFITLAVFLFRVTLERLGATKVFDETVEIVFFQLIPTVTKLGIKISFYTYKILAFAVNQMSYCLRTKKKTKTKTKTTKKIVKE